MNKLIFIIAGAAVLAGCAAPQPGPPNYGTRGMAQSGDPSQWQVVSVTPVPLGTGERAGDRGVVTSSNVIVNPAPPGAPVYGPQTGYGYGYGYPPVYVQDPYWTAPVSIGLGLSFGRSWGGHRHHRHHRQFRRR